MRILLLAVLLSGCGSACSSSLESAPDPASPSAASSAEVPTETPTTAGAEPEPEPAAAPKPAPPPEPVDPEDERVVYANDGVRTKVRFAPLDDVLLVADTVGEGAKSEQLSLRDTYGRGRWSHDYTQIDDVALDAEGAYATADGHLWSYDLETGEPTDRGEAKGDLVLSPSHVYIHSLGVVRRVPRGGGAAEKVVKHPTPGFHRIAVEGDKLVMLASAYRNRPARFPKLGALLVAPAKGGALRERFTAMYSPGPLLDLDDGYAYFGASEKGEEDFEYRLMRVPLKGKVEADVVVGHPIAVFAVEGEHIFALARLGEEAGLFAFSTGEADPVQMSAFEGGASKVALSESFVYWESRGRIYRVAKEVPEPPPEPAEDGAEETTEAPARARAKPAKAKPASAKPAKAKPAKAKPAGPNADEAESAEPKAAKKPAKAEVEAE